MVSPCSVRFPDRTAGIDPRQSSAHLLIMSLFRKLFGRRLASWEEDKQELGVITAVPVLGLDALASTGYGPEAALEHHPGLHHDNH